MPSETERDPLDELDTVAQHLAFWRKTKGEAFAMEMLACMDQPVPPKPWLLPQEERLHIWTAEELEDVARELESRGLAKLVRAVRDLAAKRPRAIDISPYPPGTTDHRAWLASMKRKKKR